MDRHSRPAVAPATARIHFSFISILKCTFLSVLILFSIRESADACDGKPAPADAPESPSPALPPIERSKAIHLPPALSHAPARNLSANILMVWRTPGTNKTAHRSFHFTPDELEVFARVTSSLPKESLNDLMERTKSLSIPEFIAVLKQKESLAAVR